MVNLLLKVLQSGFGGVFSWLMVAGFVALLGWGGWQTWEVSTLETDVANAERDLAQCREAKATLKQNNATLETTIVDQNRRIDSLKDQAEQAEAEAALAVEKVLRSSDGRIQEIKNSEAKGPKVLNQWLQERFLPQ